MRIDRSKLIVGLMTVGLCATSIPSAFALSSGAVARLTKDAQAGSPQAMLDLASHYVDQDSTKDVIKWLNKLFLNHPQYAKEGIALAQKMRAKLREDYPWITDEDLKSVQFSLGAYLYQQKSNDAIEVLIKEAELYSAVSQAVLNVLYRNFHETLPEAKKIRQYFRKAAYDGLPGAQSVYGDYLLNGIGGPQDIAEGVRLLEESNKAVSFLKLGEYAMQVEDKQKVIDYFTKAGELGDARGYYNLAVLLINGQTYDQARVLLEQVLKMQSNNGHAMIKLGGLYYLGLGGEKKLKDAITLFQVAAKFQDKNISAAAEYNLGVAYRDGQGVDQSKKKAKEFFEKSAAKGFDKAKAALKLL